MPTSDLYILESAWDLFKAIKKPITNANKLANQIRKIVLSTNRLIVINVKDNARKINIGGRKSISPNRI